MRISRILLLAVLSSQILISCSSSSSSVASGGANPAESAILWHQTSAEYDALCYQAFEVAKQRIMKIQSGGIDEYNGKQIAVILDLDETVLDNSPYNAKLILEGRDFSQSSWEEWVSQEKAEMVPGALEFLNFLRDQSIKYIFISNRNASQLKSTYNNLVKNGVELTDGDILLDDGRSKKERRESISEYEIALLIGDNLADFDEAFEMNKQLNERSKFLERDFTNEFGNKFVILPNPLYGDWQKAIENKSKKREDQLKLLKTY